MVRRFRKIIPAKLSSNLCILSSTNHKFAGYLKDVFFHLTLEFNRATMTSKPTQ